MTLKNSFENLYSCDSGDLLKALNSASFLTRVNAIIASASNRKAVDLAVTKKLKALMSDDEPVFGIKTSYCIRHFATAACHILGIQAYGGSEDMVWELIKSKLKFYGD